MSDGDADKDGWIRRRAYQLWQESGEGHGQHDDHGHQAERDYEATTRTPGGAQAPTGDLEEDLIETPPPASPTAGEPAREAAPAPATPVKGGPASLGKV